MTTRPLADIDSPWNLSARRFIDAPVFRLREPSPPHPHARWWRLEMIQDGMRHVIENDTPTLDTAPVWDKIRIGSWVNCVLFELDQKDGWAMRAIPIGHAIQGTQMGIFTRAPDWPDHEESPLDYLHSVRRNLDWFDSHERNPHAYYREPGMPAWWWHASESADPKTEKFARFSYPALGAVAISAYLKAAKLMPDRAARYRTLARTIGDWFLRNRTPMDGAAPGLPWTSMEEGRFATQAEEGVVNLSRAFRPGLAMLALYRDTNDATWLDYAQHIAEVQSHFIREDGSMPYRIRPLTGEVVEEYTPGHVWVALFLEVLHETAPDPCWLATSQRICSWLLKNPLRDFYWKACFEDVGVKPAFSNLSSGDAQAAVRLLCRHAREHSDYLAHARKLMRWVEDQFVSFGDEASLFVRTYYPAVREQWICDYTMEGHAANYAASCRALHDATGEAVWKRKEVATLNTMVRSQRADGALSTWGIDRETGLGGLGHGWNWFNANHAADAELLNFVFRQQQNAASFDEPY